MVRHSRGTPVKRAGVLAMGRDLGKIDRAIPQHALWETVIPLDHFDVWRNNSGRRLENHGRGSPDSCGSLDREIRMAKTAPHPHPDKLQLYEKLVATNPQIELKGATVPYTSINGNMSSYLSKEGKLALRLPAADIETFLKKYRAKLCEAYGVVQKEYVEVPDALLAKTAELKKYFTASVEYVSGLKPKKAAKG